MGQSEECLRLGYVIELKARAASCTVHRLFDYVIRVTADGRQRDSETLSSSDKIRSLTRRSISSTSSFSLSAVHFLRSKWGNILGSASMNRITAARDLS
jgi:hypothetical protein